jgi:voltage-gated potassium channel
MSAPRGRRFSNARRRVAAAQRPHPVERRMDRFLREPPTIRTATSVIVVAMASVVVVGGVLFRLLDHSEYGSIWNGMWLSIQTVTTVGYGDVTPKNASGRIIASVVMLQGISFVAIITAAVTSVFVTRAQRQQAEDGTSGPTEQELIHARFDELDERLDRLEKALGASREE